MALFTAVLLLTTVATSSHCARILGLFPIPAKSHMISFSPLLQELARRGHHVTVIGGYPVNPPIANFTDIAIDSSFLERRMVNLLAPDEQPSILTLVQLINELSVNACEEALKNPEVAKLIEDEEQTFDLIILEVFFSECFYGFVHKYKAPVIHISSNTISPFLGDGMGNPHTPSYIPDIMIGTSTTRMTFLQRMLNSISNVGAIPFRELFLFPNHNKVMRKYFKDPSLPSIQEMEKNASLLLLNAHFTMDVPRPFTPNTIEVGGMHIKPAKKLPKDLQKLMDTAKHGVVYFSLGSSIPCKHIPLDMKQAFIDAFSKLEQTVLWKWDGDDDTSFPKNVHTSKWMPQNDILAHPNLRVFMTHSGLLSTQEATYHGVPLLAIPVHGDQIVNAANVEAKGYAVSLDLKNVSVESVSWALKELLSDNRFRENAKRYSKIFLDRPETPLERAVYWTEYVIRHKGAHHLRSAALDLWWFQYFLLDVLAVLLGVAILIICVLFFSFRTLYRLFTSKKISKVSKAKKRK